jgi:hypothetical protein
MIDQFTRTVHLILKDGLRPEVTIDAEERLDGGKMLYTLALSWQEKTIVGTSERSFFDALRTLRLSLEKEGVLLDCLGASEDVYPSPMQESMGPALKAYRTQLGRQALSKDIVDIFDSDGSARPATVEQQSEFHRKWLASLG